MFSLHPSLYFFLKSFFHLFLMFTLVPDENSMEDPLCNSSFGSMVTLDYVNPLTVHGCREAHGRQGFCLLAEALRPRPLPHFQPVSPAKEVQVPKLSEVRPLDFLAFNGNSSLDHWELLLLRNTDDVHNLDGELQQWNLHRFLYGQDRGHLSLYNDGHFTNFVQDLQL